MTDERSELAHAQATLRTGPGERLRMGEHVIDVDTLRVLTREGQPRFTPKAMAVLLELAAQPGRTLTRTELLDRVWANSFPTPDVLTQAITNIRCVLCDNQPARRYIETIPALGYRLIAPVTNVLPGKIAEGFFQMPSPATNARDAVSNVTVRSAQLTRRRWLLLVVVITVMCAAILLAALVALR
jgi:DNA-binding winged helix-turn-helix (wHTH) protein